MRGLRLFIADLRKCKGKDDELKRINKELANIRSKFNGKKLLNGYQKKKYVSKLLLMFLLGHEIDFGFMEAVNLLSSNAYSEKQIGYLFISVIMGNNNNLIPLITNSIKCDLSSKKTVFQNLALQFMANNFLKEVPNHLVEKVLDMLFSSETDDFVKQTAALTLLQFLRFKPDFRFDRIQEDRIINLISNSNLGIVTSAASLIEFLAKTLQFESYRCLTSHCITRLNTIVNAICTDLQDYCYYFTPVPWLTVKLLRILQNFPAPTDMNLKSRLLESLNLILDKIHDPAKTKKIEHINAKYAVIFEAISLIIHMEIDASLLHKAINILSSALNKKESNIRFMALDIMTQSSNNEICLTNIKMVWRSILCAVKDETDTTIKKRAIDLLYIICDKNNVKPIVEEMLCFLKTETEISEDIVLKAGNLAERFCTKSLWYVDLIFKMLRICGDAVNDSVWHTLVKVVIENHSMQEYAAKVSYAGLHDSPCHDIVVKVAGYILGEFGHLIAKNPKTSHTRQFNKLREFYFNCSPSTRSILLTTFMKFFNIYSDLKDEVQSIFRDKFNCRSENEEIQQRAVEYWKLSEIASQSLLATVLDEMPCFTRRELAVAATTSQLEFFKTQAFEIGPIERHLSGQTLSKFSSERNLSLGSKSERAHVMRSASHSNLNQDVYNRVSNYDLLTNLFKDIPIAEGISDNKRPVPTRMKNTHYAINEHFLQNLLFNQTGVLFENSMIQIFVDCEFKERFGKFRLTCTNKSMFPFSDFFIKGDSARVENNKFSTRIKSNRCVLQAEESTGQDIRLECLRCFSAKPSIIVNFICQGKEYELKIMLPLTVNKFIEPISMDKEGYWRRWENFDLGTVKDFTAKFPMIYEATGKKLRAFGIIPISEVDIIENTDPIEINYAGVFHTLPGKIGFLIKLERFPYFNRYRLSVRSSQLELCETITDLLFQLL